MLLLPGANLHIPLEQIAGNDEMLDFDGLPFYQAFRPPVVFADLAWGGNVLHHKEKMMWVD